jgi:hypothetical protein
MRSGGWYVHSKRAYLVDSVHGEVSALHARCEAEAMGSMRHSGHANQEMKQRCGRHANELVLRIILRASQSSTGAV